MKMDSARCTCSTWPRAGNCLFQERPPESSVASSGMKNHDLAFSLNSARSPLDAYSVDIKTAKLERWTTSETRGLKAENFAEPQLVKWKAFDGHEISGWLFLPPAGKFSGKRPVIVNIHGGPEAQSRPIYQARNNYYLNELGVAIVFPNIRGSVGFGKTYVAP